MANLLLGWPIFSDPSVLFTPTMSGGSWVAALPLTNLQDRRLHRVARSTNALAASTQWDTDLKTARTIGVVALPKSNISLAGTVRVRGYTGAAHAGNVYDSGTITFGPSGLTLEDTAGLNLPFVVAFTPVSARYWWIEITDTANAAGFVEVSRAVIAGAYQPAINMSFGARLNLEDPSKRAPSDGGATLYDRKEQYRVLQAVLEQIAEAEAFDSYWRMGKQLGITRQLFVMWASDDTLRKHDRSFLATFRRPNGLAAPYLARYEGGIELVEDL